MNSPITENLDAHWKSFINKTNNFDKPYLYKNFFNEPFITENEVKEVFTNWSATNINLVKEGTRIYFDGVLDFTKANLLNEHPPLSNENLQEYFLRVFGTLEFSMVLRNAGLYNDEINIKVMQLMKPLTEKYGYPFFKIDITLAMGKYGYTPFGIHHDSNIGTTFHIMSKGQSKRFHSWNKKEFIARTGRDDRNFYDIEPHLKYGTEDTTSDLDIFHLPTQHYHIAYTEEFSIDLIVLLKPIQELNLLKESMDLLFKKMRIDLESMFDSEIVSNEFKLDVDREGFYKSIFSIDKAYLNAPLEQLLKQSLKDLKHSSMSNGGCKAFPSQLDIKLDSISPTTHFVLTSPFVMTYYNDEEDLTLYVRGRKISLNMNTEIVNLVDRFNSGEKISFEEIRSSYLPNKVFSIEESKLLLKMIIDFRGIKLINSTD